MMLMCLKAVALAYAAFSFTVFIIFIAVLLSIIVIEYMGWNDTERVEDYQHTS